MATPINKLMAQTGLTDQTSTYSRRRRKPKRFGRNQTVSSAVAQRSGARLAALEKGGITVKGVDGTDGYTGREARLIKRARRRQKNARSTYSI